MNFNFGEVLYRAWQITWKHKVLWIFGILSSCSRGSGGGSGGGGGNTGYQAGSDENLFNDRMFDQIGRWIEDNLWIIIALIIGLFLLSIIFYFIGFMGRIGLIKGTYNVEKGAESLAFGELFTESLPYFWRVFGLSFLIGLAFLVVFFPLIFLGILTAGIAFLCIIPLVCIMIPVSWAVMIVLEQANVAIVIEDIGMFEGFRRGWDVAKANVGPVVVMALILGFGGGIISVVLALPIFLMLLPLIPVLVSGDFQNAVPLWTAGICFAGYLPVIIALNGILNTYIQSAWTLTFMRLTAPKENAPVMIEANA